MHRPDFHPMKNTVKTENGGDSIGQVRQGLSSHFGGVDVRMGRPISVRHNSEIFCASISTPSPLHAAVKRCFIPKTRTPDPSSATAQYLALERVNSALEERNRRYRVPAPLCLMTELATFAMSWVDGESLTRKLHSAAIFTDGPKWFLDIGAWLGNFHMAGPVGRTVVRLDDRIDILDELRRDHPDNTVFADAFRLLQRTASTVAGTEASTSWLHGDCKTDNFFLSGENVYGIDISLSYESAIEYDLAQFLNNLELILSAPQYLHLRWARSCLEKAFWRGYRQTGPSVSDTYLNWVRLDFALTLWDKQLTGRRRSIRSWMIDRMFSKLIARLSGNLVSPLWIFSENA